MRTRSSGRREGARSSTTTCSKGPGLRLERRIADAGLRIVREELHARRRFVGSLQRSGAGCVRSALTQDALISNMEYVLARGPGRTVWRIDRAPRGRSARRRRPVSSCSATTRRRPAGCAGTGNTAQLNNPAACRDLDRAREVGDRRPDTPRCLQVAVAGQQVRGSWGMDVMVAPERQRQGLGECCSARGTATSAPPWPGALGVVSSPVQQAAVAGRWTPAVPRQAADAPGAAHPDLAGGRQPPRLGRHAPDRQGRGADRRSLLGAAHPALRRQLHRALGVAGASSISPSGATPPTCGSSCWRHMSATSSRRSDATTATSVMPFTGTSANRASDGAGGLSRRS